MNTIAAELVVDTDWLPWAVVAFGAISACLGWYINWVVSQKTKTINTFNDGSHLADVPKRLDRLETKMEDVADDVAETKATGKVVADNQQIIMGAILPPRD